MTARFTKMLSQLLLKGLFGVLPIALSLAALVWLIDFTQNLFNGILTWLFPNFGAYPGMGLLFAILALIAFGFFLQLKYFNLIYFQFQKILRRIPFIRFVYSAIEDFAFYFGETGKTESNVVLVRQGNSEMEVVGLITRETVSELAEFLPEDRVAVYIPMSFAIGGYTIFVPRKNIQVTNLPVDKTLRNIVTGWMKKTKEENL